MGVYIFLAALTIIVCVLLILIILIQNSKGGGLASNFSSSNQIMGVRKTTDFLEKSTWTLAISLLALCMISIFVIPRNKGAVRKSEIQELVDKNQMMPVDNNRVPPKTQQLPGKK